MKQLLNSTSDPNTVVPAESQIRAGDDDDDDEGAKLPTTGNSTHSSVGVGGAVDPRPG